MRAPLWKLCEDGKLDEVRSALARGEDVNDKDPGGRTALMYAVREKHNSIVKLLLDQPGVKTNEKNNRGGHTALHLAAGSNNREGARMLLLHLTMDSANAKNNMGYSGYSGDTAVMIAARGDHKEVLSELVTHESVSLDIGNVVASVR